jgi:hypothetical protein
MGARDVRCAACGYEFPIRLEKGRFEGWEYSDLADTVLMVAAGILGLGIAGAALYWLLLLIHGMLHGFGLIRPLRSDYWWPFAVYLPLSLISQLSLVIVLLRSRHVKPENERSDGP